MGWKGAPSLDESLARITRFDNDRKEAGRTQGYVIPQLADLALGEAKEFDLAILHIDIHDYKGITSKMTMRGIAKFLSIYLTEMTYVVKEFGGDIESYSGDRVTALFGAGQDRNAATLNCLQCGLSMLTVIQYSLCPYLSRINLPSFKCSVGMDFGPTWIERVGIRNQNQLTLVGLTVSIASQLQELSAPNKILLGNDIFISLPQNWQYLCNKVVPDKSWGWTQGNPPSPYPYYECTGIWTGYSLAR